MLECDSKGREYTIEGHDITLRIPKGAIAEGTKLHFEIGVAAYGPFKFPENSQPISPIVWLCILDGDSSMLKKPFHLILPHCLIGLSRERLSDHHVAFAKASHLLREQYYNFNKCEIDPLFASSGDKCYGVLKSDHCCFNCLTHDTARETRTDISYCLVRVECTEFTPTRNEVYFAVIYYLDTCKKVRELSHF